MAAEKETKSTTRPYVVGYVTETNDLRLIGAYTASTPKGAVEAALDAAANEIPAGTVNFVAVVQSSWQPFHGTGEMKMVFSVGAGHITAGNAIDGPREAVAEPIEPQAADSIPVADVDDLTVEQERTIAEAEAGEIGEVG